MITLSCCAAYGGGGLGQHLAALVEWSRERGELGRYYTSVARAGDVHNEVIPTGASRWIGTVTPVRFSNPLRSLVGWWMFDRQVAARLQPADVLVGFDGQAACSFRAARRLGYRELWLVSATVHVAHVRRQQQRAHAAYPIERTEMPALTRRRILEEYALADRILYASEYVRQSFIAEGVPAAKLRWFPIAPSPRFSAGVRARTDDRFRIVYVGALSVAKGVPLLIEAFRRFPDPSAELVLVGGSGSRGMRRHLESCCARDPRIRVCPGDPLPHLRNADVYVHPSYHDGFGYAPMEALACGVPVVVTEDTGMREHVDGVNGYVVPTGSVDAIVDALVAAHARRSSAPGASLAGAGVGRG